MIVGQQSSGLVRSGFVAVGFILAVERIRFPNRPGPDIRGVVIQHIFKHRIDRFPADRIRPLHTLERVGQVPGGNDRVVKLLLYFYSNLLPGYFGEFHG
ncbi:hypothetical protein D1872_247750 [compost metagenome]